jgi:hypothetical protein
MLKPRFHSAIARMLLVTFFLTLTPMTADIWSATCTGADPCKACKNCKYCKHCAKDGGKCGVCK